MEPAIHTIDDNGTKRMYLGPVIDLQPTESLISMNTLRSLIAIMLLLVTVPNIHAEETNIFALSLEELLQVTITTSARRPQPLKRATSAMYIITSEDIRLAGVTKLDDIFRLVPSMDVAHASSANGTFFALEPV